MNSKTNSLNIDEEDNNMIYISSTLEPYKLMLLKGIAIGLQLQEQPNRTLEQINLFKNSEKEELAKT